ncbi:MAG: hypothetical protein ACPLX8_01755, partial [Nanopusillaceae archaeon]
MISYYKMVTTLEETHTYPQYITEMRKIISERSGYRSASYFGVVRKSKTDGERVDTSTYPIKKEMVFLAMYSYMVPGYILNAFNLSNNLDHILIVISLDGGKSLVYKKKIEKGKERSDIYIGDLGGLRLKLPESLMVTEDNTGHKDKLVETRPYEKYLSKFRLIDPNRAIEENIRIMEKSIFDIVEVPTLLALPMVMLRSAYFPTIRYMSNPYYQYNPYVFITEFGSKMGYDTTIIVPVKTARNLLSALLITSIIKSPTVEPYLLNLPWEF